VGEEFPHDWGRTPPPQRGVRRGLAPS